MQRENFLLLISAKELVSRIYTEQLQHNNEMNNPIKMCKRFEQTLHKVDVWMASK